LFVTKKLFSRRLLWAYFISSESVVFIDLPFADCSLPLFVFAVPGGTRKSSAQVYVRRDTAYDESVYLLDRRQYREGAFCEKRVRAPASG
jgi:hypothetical protein